MLHNTRTKHGMKPRYVVKRSDIIKKNGLRSPPKEPRLCWLCIRPMSWQGHNVQQHHIFTRVKSQEWRLVHGTCHKRLHQVMSVPSDMDAGIFEKECL